MQINQPATGAVVIRTARTPTAQQLAADNSAINDANGPLVAVNELWQDSTGRLLGRGERYQLAASAAGAINYQVVVQDPAGFRTTLASNFNTPAQDKAVAALLPGLDLATARKFKPSGLAAFGSACPGRRSRRRGCTE